MDIAITTDTDGTYLVGGYLVAASGFADADQYGRALHRAISDGIRCTPADRPGVWVVTNSASGSTYITTIRTRTCPAGLVGVGCKHIALVVLMNSIGAGVPHLAAVRPERVPAGRTGRTHVWHLVGN